MGSGGKAPVYDKEQLKFRDLHEEFAEFFDLNPTKEVDELSFGFEPIEDEEIRFLILLKAIKASSLEFLIQQRETLMNQLEKSKDEPYQILIHG